MTIGILGISALALTGVAILGDNVWRHNQAEDARVAHIAQERQRNMMAAVSGIEQARTNPYGVKTLHALLVIRRGAKLVGEQDYTKVASPYSELNDKTVAKDSIVVILDPAVNADGTFRYDGDCAANPSPNFRTSGEIAATSTWVTLSDHATLQMSGLAPSEIIGHFANNGQLQDSKGQPVSCATTLGVAGIELLRRLS